MGIKLLLCGWIGILYGLVPVSKTYYSDHIHVKYLPSFIFADSCFQKEEYLKRIKHVRDDMYHRELYSRNYHRWIGRNPTITVDGDKTNYESIFNKLKDE